MKVGIVGLPNAGKSTLFNALTSGGAIDRQLPVHDDRAERRRRPGAGRAPRSGRQDGEELGARPGDDRLPRHRRPGQRRERGGGARQPVPRLDPGDRRDLPRRPLPRGRGRDPPRRAGRPDRRHRDDRDRADPLRLRAGRAPHPAGRQAGEDRRQSGGRRAGLAGGGERGAGGGQAGALGAGPRGRARRGPQPRRDHLEADPLRRQRRRGNGRGAGGASPPTPTRSTPGRSR